MKIELDEEDITFLIKDNLSITIDKGEKSFMTLTEVVVRLLWKGKEFSISTLDIYHGL